MYHFILYIFLFLLHFFFLFVFYLYAFSPLPSQREVNFPFLIFFLLSFTIELRFVFIMFSLNYRKCARIHSWSSKSRQRNGGHSTNRSFASKRTKRNENEIKAAQKKVKENEKSVWKWCESGYTYRIYLRYTYKVTREHSND